LEELLSIHQYLLRDQFAQVDIAIFPFIRQFSMVDEHWFDSTQYSKLKVWLSNLKDSQIFNDIMQKHPVWQDA
jgi:glutathione S-transferase